MQFCCILIISDAHFSTQFFKIKLTISLSASHNKSNSNESKTDKNNVLIELHQDYCIYVLRTQKVYDWACNVDIEIAWLMLEKMNAVLIRVNDSFFSFFMVLRCCKLLKAKQQYDNNAKLNRSEHPPVC